MESSRLLYQPPSADKIRVNYFADDFIYERVNWRYYIDFLIRPSVTMTGGKVPEEKRSGRAAQRTTESRQKGLVSIKPNACHASYKYINFRFGGAKIRQRAGGKERMCNKRFRFCQYHV